MCVFTFFSSKCRVFLFCIMSAVRVSFFAYLALFVSFLHNKRCACFFFLLKCCACFLFYIISTVRVSFRMKHFACYFCCIISTVRVSFFV